MLHTSPPPSQRHPLTRISSLIISVVALNLSVSTSFAETPTHTNATETVKRLAVEHAEELIEVVADCSLDSSRCGQTVVKGAVKVAIKEGSKAALGSLVSQSIKRSVGVVGGAVVDCALGDDSCGQAFTKAAVVGTTAAFAPSAAVAGASALGMTAGTGTAISSLGGAAAFSATAATVGQGAITVSGGLLAGVAAPAVIGGAVIGAVGMGVGYLIYSIFN